MYVFREMQAQQKAELVNNSNLRIVNNVDDLLIPKKLLFEDFCCRTPKFFIDLSGWLISEDVFDELTLSCTNVHTLLLNECKGFASADLEKLRGTLRKIHTFSMRSTISVSVSFAKVLGSWKHLRYLT